MCGVITKQLQNGAIKKLPLRIFLNNATIVLTPELPQNENPSPLINQKQNLNLLYEFRFHHRAVSETLRS